MSGPRDLGGVSLRRVLAKNVSVSVAAKGLYTVTRFFLPPLILHYVSLDLYGIWAACFILIGYMGMGAFGVSNVYIRYVAAYRVSEDWDRINRLVSTGIAVTVAVSLVTLAGLWFALPWVVQALGISSAFRSTAFILIYGTAVTFVLDLTLGAFGHVLTGLQRITETTAVWVASFLLETVLIVTLLPVLGIYALLAAFVVRYLFATIACIVLCRRALPHLVIRPRLFDRQALRLFYRHGSVVQASGILGMLLYSIEKVIAGMFLGVRTTGLFDLGEKFAVMGSQFASSITGVVLPAAAHLHAQGERGRLVELYVRGSRYLSALSGMILGFMPAFAGPLMLAWVGPEHQPHTVAAILAVFTVPFHVHVLTGPGSAVHRAMDRPARELVYPVTQALLVLLIVSLGFAWYGRTVMVVAWSVALSMLASAFAYLTYTNHRLGVPQRQYVRRVLLPSACPYLVAWIVATLLQPWFRDAGSDRLWLAAIIAAAGGLYVTLVLAIDWIGAERYERDAAKNQIVRALARLTGRPGAVPPIAPQTDPQARTR